jgi:hypothetical protein
MPAGATRCSTHSADAPASRRRFTRQPLLCRYHHTHFAQKGWSCRINTDRLPEWIPPRWIDQDQQPHINPASDGCMPNSDSNATTSDADKTPHDQAQWLAQVPSVGSAGTRSATSSGASCSLRVHSAQ